MGTALVGTSIDAVQHPSSPCKLGRPGHARLTGHPTQPQQHTLKRVLRCLPVTNVNGHALRQRVVRRQALAAAGEARRAAGLRARGCSWRHASLHG